MVAFAYFDVSDWLCNYMGNDFTHLFYLSEEQQQALEIAQQQKDIANKPARDLLSTIPNVSASEIYQGESPIIC